MDKIYHARVAWYHWVFLILITFAIIWSFTNGSSVFIMGMIMALIIVERSIHTTYTITDGGKLILYYGRFSKKKELDLKEIRSVKRCTTMRILNFHLTRYVLIECANGKLHAIEPIKEEEFVHSLLKANPEIETN